MYMFSCKRDFQEKTRQAHDVNITSPQRRCNVMCPLGTILGLLSNPLNKAIPMIINSIWASPCKGLDEVDHHENIPI